MNFKGQNVLMACIIGVVGVLILFLGLYVSAHNKETYLRNRFTSQQKSNESSFDKMWKVIQQQTGVASEERETFRETFVEIMQAQQGVAGKGALASFFQQSGVTVSSDLYAKLMTTIEAQRESFHRDQQKLLEIVRQHDDVRTMLPYSFFVGGRPPLEAKIVISTKTDEVFSSGKDDEVDLFRK